MAQLTDDCFAFSGPLLPLDEMERLIGERVAPVDGSERVCLHAARGRVTAAGVIAPVALPPFDNSAVDGYAVRHADLARGGDTRLAIAGRLPAGARADIALKPGQAIRIFTGAAMPAGADTVFMQEDVTVDGSEVTVPKGLKLGANRRLAGEDLPSGHVALPAGTVLEPQHIALLAAIGVTEVEVRRRLKVAIFSTGDEVVEPGSERGGAAIYDANRYLLSELLERLGIDRLVWIATAFVGLVLASGVIASGNLQGHASYLIGIGEALAGSVLYASVTLIAKSLGDLRPHLLTLAQCLVGVVCLPLIAAFVAPLGSVHLSPQQWFWVVGMGVLHTGLSYVLIYGALPKLATPVIAVLLFVYPLTAIAVDALVYGRALSPLQLAGMALIVAASLGVNLGWPLLSVVLPGMRPRSRSS